MIPSSFSNLFLKNIEIPVGTSWLLGNCMEARGRQDLWFRTKPEVLESLRELAMIQSAESSNRIEGVTVEKNRLLGLLQSRVKPRDRSEEEVLGYRKALDWIHSKYSSIKINSKTILNLHSISQSSGDAGEWKKRNNEIIEILPNGARQIRFTPIEPKYTPKAIDQLCLGYQDTLSNENLPDLLAIALFIFDFLCIHPFRDGNGRVSRLLTTLLLYQSGYLVGKYISLERIIEESKDEYYTGLKASSKDWHQVKHDIIPFWNYFLGIIKLAYKELSERVNISSSPATGKTELIRQTILSQLGSFTLREIQANISSASPQLVKKVLSQLKTDGKIALTGRGRSAKWEVL